MTRSQTRLLALVAGLACLVVVSALFYQWGMERFEGEQRGFWDSLGFAAETVTTTGYGGDSHWNHPVMVVFVVVLQFVGVFLVFLVFPIYFIPFLEERFEARLPRQISAMNDHVVIYRFGAAVENLVGELDRAHVASVVVETDESVARSLMGKGIKLVVAEEEDEGLQAAHLMQARALITNGPDEENAAAILGARQAGFVGEIVALVEEPVYRTPMSLAGASAVYTPRHVLAAALAARASHRINPRVSGIQQLGRSLRVRELRIHEGSALAGRTLEESGIGARTGATVIGQWVGGHLMAPPTADMRLEPRGILIVAGSLDNINRLAKLTEGTTPLPRKGPFVVAGFGEVGSKVHEMLRDAGELVRVVDKRDKANVDVVGDVLDPDVLRKAAADEARAVILALDSDDATMFATVIVRDITSDVPIIARVNHAHNMEKIRRAGVDFALSLAQVSSQILAQRLLGVESVAVDPQVRLVKVSTEGLVGLHPSEAGVRERSGCSVVAVERGDEVLVELGPDFRFQADDEVYVCGSDSAVQTYLGEFPQDRSDHPR